MNNAVGLASTAWYPRLHAHRHAVAAQAQEAVALLGVRVRAGVHVAEVPAAYPQCGQHQMRDAASSKADYPVL